MWRFTINLAETRWVLALALFAGLISGSGFAGDDPTPSPPAQGTSPQGYHDGSIRDVSAIGNRNVGCGRGLGNWYTLDSQVAMGKAFAQQVEASAKIVKDPMVTEYVNRVGQNLVRNSDSHVPFTIKVIDSDEVNAFALPGGYFYVNSGLLLEAGNEAELAGVMSHEIGHVAACHAARQQTRGSLAKLMSLPLIFVGGGIGYVAMEAVSVAVPMTFMEFSRTFESQADYLGVEYMYKAGYDPQAFLSFFERVEKNEKKKTGKMAKMFESHPPTPERMKATQREISTILPPRNEYILDTSEFQEVKSRLQTLENYKKMQKGKDDDRPTLRKQTPSQTSTSSSTSSTDHDEDDRPTLKRRNDSDTP